MKIREKLTLAKSLLSERSSAGVPANFLSDAPFSHNLSQQNPVGTFAQCLKTHQVPPFRAGSLGFFVGYASLRSAVEQKPLDRVYGDVVNFLSL